MFYFWTSWIAFRRWLRLFIPWCYCYENSDATNQQNEQTETSRPYRLLNWRISYMLQKNILRNVLVWTCTNLWIMMMLNDKSYMILQRFYCCGSKVVLNRLLCGLCGPRLCSHGAKRKKKNFTESHFIWHSALWKDLTVGFLKYTLLVIIEV